MKITECQDLYYPYQLGGGENRSYELTKRLARNNEVQVITSSLANCPSHEKLVENLKINRIGLIPNPTNRRSVLSLLSFLLKLRNTKLDSDIVHYNQYTILAKKSNDKSVFTLHDLFLGRKNSTIQTIAASLAERRMKGKIKEGIVIVPSPAAILSSITILNPSTVEGLTKTCAEDNSL